MHYVVFVSIIQKLALLGRIACDLRLIAAGFAISFVGVDTRVLGVVITAVIDSVSIGCQNIFQCSVCLRCFVTQSVL